LRFFLIEYYYSRVEKGKQTTKKKGRETMQNIKRIRYNTGNSWNGSKSPAYNLKIHNVINRDLQNKVFELLETDDFYSEINFLIDEFNTKNDYQWQAGFNGRSGGYLVLYRGTKTPSEHKSHCTACGQRNFTAVEDTGSQCGRCGQNTRVNFTTTQYDIGVYPFKNIEDNEVPSEVLKSFRKLAVDIVKTTEAMAKECRIVEEEYTIVKTRKVLAS
jgi:hypothetical protein